MLPVFAAGSSDWPATYASKKQAGRCDENEDAPFKRANVFSARIMSSRAVNFAFHTDFVERLINTSLFPKKLVTEGDADSFVCQDGDAFRGIEEPIRDPPRPCHSRVIRIRTSIRSVNAAVKDKDQVR